jgi:DNA-binding MarR family transcriptional regulator
VTLRPEESLRYQINRLARLFEQALRQRTASHGVVPGQFPALLALYAEDGLPQGELSRRTSVEQPTMANTLKRMERDGLIHRVLDPHDRRRAYIHLTERAQELERPLTQAARAINSVATRHLQSDERDAFMHTLTGLIDGLQTTDPEPAAARAHPHRNV